MNWDTIGPTLIIQGAGMLMAVVLMIMSAWVIRWMLLTPGLDLGEHVKAITSDLHSALAVLVIGTVCIIALSGQDVPSAVENIALVIVGYYFGRRSERTSK